MLEGTCSIMDIKADSQGKSPGRSLIRSLHDLLERGSVQEVETAILAGTDIEEKWDADISPHESESSRGRQRKGHKATPLQRVVTLRRVDIIKLLLNYGADIHVRDVTGFSPLHIAANQDLQK